VKLSREFSDAKLEPKWVGAFGGRASCEARDDLLHEVDMWIESVDPGNAEWLLNLFKAKRNGKRRTGRNGDSL
jgi:hypothetical protein